MMSSEVEQVTRQTVAKGGILAMLYFDIHARDKEAIQQLGTGFINGLIQRPGVVYGLGEIQDPLSGGEGRNWSSSISFKILTKDFLTLCQICLAHSPFNVEILRPDEIKLSLSDVHEVLATLAATTAEYKKYIITKVASPSEIAEMQANLERRANMGKAILSKKDDEDGA